MQEARIAYFKGSGEVGFFARRLPALRRGQLLARTREGGICGSEAVLWTNETFWTDVRAGRINRPPLGHESLCIVEGVGEGVTELGVGDWIIPWYERGAGDPEARGLASHAVLEARDCTRVPDGSSLRVLGEPTGCAVGAIEKINPRMGDVVAVVGTGAMVQLLVRLLWHTGVAAVYVFGRRDEALDQVKALEPRTEVINYKVGSARNALRELSGTPNADVVVDGTGEQEGIDVAASLLRAGDVERAGSTFAWMGYSRVGNRTLDMGAINAGDIRIVNCHNRPANIAVSAIAAGQRLIDAGRLDESDLKLDRYPVRDINEAFRAANARRDGLARAVVTFD